MISLAQLVIACLLFSALGHHPYSYYMWIRRLVTMLSLLLAAAHIKGGRYGPALFYLFLAGLFQPILLVRLSKPAWDAIDLVFGTVLVIDAARQLLRSDSTAQTPQEDILNGKEEAVDAGMVKSNVAHR